MRVNLQLLAVGVVANLCANVRLEGREWEAKGPLHCEAEFLGQQWHQGVRKPTEELPGA